MILLILNIEQVKGFTVQLIRLPGDNFTSGQNITLQNWPT